MKKKVELTVMIPPQADDRLRVMMERMDTTNESDVVLKALHYLDRAFCAMSEGGKPAILEKDGRLEEFIP